MKLINIDSDNDLIEYCLSLILIASWWTKVLSTQVMLLDTKKHWSNTIKLNCICVCNFFSQ